MSDIVKKLGDAPAPQPSAPGSSGTTELRWRVVAETLERQRKRAEAWGETAAGERRNSRWEMYSDEGADLGGGDSAPPPLAYFSAGIAF